DVNPAKGEWRDGRLPSVKQLQQEHDVGRDTLPRAVEILRDEGPVFTVPRRGTYVSPDTRKRPLPSSFGDHLGTTRCTCGRTTRRWPPVVPGRLNASELRSRRLPVLGVKGSPVQIRPSRRRSEGWFRVSATSFGCNGSARALPSVASAKRRGVSCPSRYADQRLLAISASGCWFAPLPVDSGELSSRSFPGR